MTTTGGIISHPNIVPTSQNIFRRIRRIKNAPTTPTSMKRSYDHNSVERWRVRCHHKSCDEGSCRGGASRASPRTINGVKRVAAAMSRRVLDTAKNNGGRVTPFASSAVFVSVSRPARRGRRVFRRGRELDRSGISKALPFSFSDSFQLQSI